MVSMTLFQESSSRGDEMQGPCMICGRMYKVWKPGNNLRKQCAERYNICDTCANIFPIPNPQPGQVKYVGKYKVKPHTKRLILVAVRIDVTQREPGTATKEYNSG